MISKTIKGLLVFIRIVIILIIAFIISQLFQECLWIKYELHDVAVSNSQFHSKKESFDIAVEFSLDYFEQALETTPHLQYIEFGCPDNQKLSIELYYDNSEESAKQTEYLTEEMQDHFEIVFKALRKKFRGEWFPSIIVQKDRVIFYGLGYAMIYSECGRPKYIQEPIEGESYYIDHIPFTLCWYHVAIIN